jgi:carbamoyl-phosphate synthase small subunit
MKVVLCLEDGSRFTGRAVTATHAAQGEIVFNTSMTGYQEICTDPSYTGQMIVMTYKHIGNIGVNTEDVESRKPWLAAMITRSYHDTPSNWRSTETLHSYLDRHTIPLLTDVDTRRLVRHLRDKGAMRALILPAATSDAEIQTAFQKVPSMEGQDLATQVSCEKTYEWTEPLHSLVMPALSRHPGLDSRVRGNDVHVTVIDFGVKLNILRHLVSRGCRVTVVPAKTSAADILALKPDGILLSNGPGDPAAVRYAPALIRDLITQKPIFGICLGHQLLALTLGAKTYKLKFGHRGANQPVKNLQTGKVTITSQNHGFAVDPKTLPAECMETEINLNDGTNQGFRHKTLPLIAVQYHPEASPGPHDADHWFDEFVRMIHV